MSDVRPEKLDDIVGQEKAKVLLNIAIKSAKIRNEAIGHICLNGSAGTGKTSIARAVANEMGTNVRLLNAAGIQRFNQLIPILDMQERGDVLFIDEIHRLPAKVFESLYTVMEDFRYDTPGQGSVDIKRFTLIGATTHMGKMPVPLRSRFVNFINLTPYTIEDMTEIVSRVAKINGLKVTGSAAVMLAKTCRGNPRLAVNRTSFLRDYMLAMDTSDAKGESADEMIKEILNLQGVDELGLTSLDHRYLKYLWKPGAASIDTLSKSLNIARVNIETEIEPYLQQLGLISIERPHGRVINRERFRELGLKL